MTDDHIRATLKEWRDEEWNLYPYQQIADCLTELLVHRQLHRQIKWCVWVRDQSAESGWKMIGAFRCEGEAHNYRAQQEEGDYLVLPFGEVPALTAR